MKPLKVIISGGGTGGHIFPAIAIANAIKKQLPDTEFLFVGANGKLEMTKVPEAGYKIEGLNIVGIQRKLTLKNLLVPFKLIGSLLKARKIIKKFNPDIAIGVGGYASGPLLKMAERRKIPTLLQEQNSYPGITNKLLAKKAHKICVGYENMERFFDKNKIIITGNPVRENIVQIEDKRENAIKHFDLDSNKKTILVIGGSLGARTINNAISESLNLIKDNNLQVIWQTGKYYYENCQTIANKIDYKGVKTLAFIKEMDLAYASADLVISRAGAMSISELCIVAKPSILVPSPNVSEDHQTKNAMALVEKGAAILIKDNKAVKSMPNVIIETIQNNETLNNLSKNIKQLAKHNADEKIAEVAIALTKK